MKKKLLLIVFAFFASYSFAQQIGDYRTKPNATLNFGTGGNAVVGNWETYTATGWVDATVAPAGNDVTPPAIPTLTIRPTSNADGLISALFNSRANGDFSNTNFVIEDGAVLINGYHQRYGFFLTVKSMTVKAGGKFSVPFKTISITGSLLSLNGSLRTRTEELVIKGSLTVETTNGTINPNPGQFIGSFSYPDDDQYRNQATTNNPYPSYTQNLNGSIGTTNADKYPAASANVVYPPGTYNVTPTPEDGTSTPFTFTFNASVLPLRLIAFKASQELGSANLKWTTAEEENVSHFEIEKSSDGATFTVVGSVNAKNTNGINFYAFLDKAIADGATYYRLKSVDKDGTFTYSEIEAVTNKLTSVSVYPNPVTNVLNAQFATVKASGTIEISNMAGAVVLTTKINKGTNSATVDVTKLATGSYILSVQIDGETSVQKIIKQ